MIAIMKTKDTIFVASDSKLTKVTDKPIFFYIKTLEEILGHSYDKIGFVNNTGYAVAGVIKQDIFDITAFCDSSCLFGGTIFDKAAKLRLIIYAPLKDVFSKAPISDKSHLKSEVVFMGFYEEKPIVIKQEFQYNDHSIKINTTITKASLIDSTETIYLGIWKDVLNAMEKYSISFDRSTHVAIVKGYVETAIKLFPQVCDGPIKIMIVTKDGCKWIQR